MIINIKYEIGIDNVTSVGVNIKNQNGGCSRLKGFKRNIEFFQKLSKSKNKFLKTKPTTIDPIAKTISGTVIT